ncbi:MAG: hypothetical protein IJZ19_01680 [Lentisphaeria bacterium]|nr:hypothetical protein [Lentisphaeria bacterium]
MSDVRLPQQIKGKWIWQKNLTDPDNTVLLFRKEFLCRSTGDETLLWISAQNHYQLFINGHYIGFGPRAHQDRGHCYIDQHDITYYLEQGINIISVAVHYSTLFMEENFSEMPGFWCQADTAKETVVASDNSWQMRLGNCFLGRRSRRYPEYALTQFQDNRYLPADWLETAGDHLPGWQAPDYCLAIGGIAPSLELHPLAPVSVAPENLNFKFLKGGRLTFPAWSEVFSNSTGGVNCAATAYIFSEEKDERKLRLYADTPFKLYCDNTLAAEGSRADGMNCTLPLHNGWNQLLLFQKAVSFSKGFTLIAADGRPFRLYQDMMEESPSTWSVSRPLKLPLENATPPIAFEQLDSFSCKVGIAEMADPGALLINAAVEPVEVSTGCLAEGEYMLAILPRNCYGVTYLEFECFEDDILDITCGTKLNADGTMLCHRDLKRTNTMIASPGLNRFLTYLPGDCKYLQIYVRKARRPIQVEQLHFLELTRVENNEATFHCTDDEFNTFWQMGVEALARSAAFIARSGEISRYDCSIQEAYVKSLNMSAVHGDYDYSASRLRQFINLQQENGNIPLLSNSNMHRSQLEQLFFYPIWLLYNFRFSSNLVELERAIPSLDALRSYLENLLDENGVLQNLDKRFGIETLYPVEGLSTLLNALFCRFMLSCNELYRLLGQNGTAKHCIQLAQKASAILKLNNYIEEKQLFADRQITDPEAKVDLLSNFCAMYGGILPLENFEVFFFEFFNFDAPFEKSSDANKPFFHFLFLEMLFALNQHEWAFRYIKEFWNTRLDKESGFNKTHFALPNVFLIREVLGVRIAEAGHTVIYFKPPHELIEGAQGEVPMARGRLKIQWKRLRSGGLDVRLDSTMPLRVIPCLSHALLHDTSFHLSENITLLDPPDELVED